MLVYPFSETGRRSIDVLHFSRSLILQAKQKEMPLNGLSPCFETSPSLCRKAPFPQGIPGSGPDAFRALTIFGECLYVLAGCERAQAAAKHIKTPPAHRTAGSRQFLLLRTRSTYVPAISYAAEFAACAAAYFTGISALAARPKIFLALASSIRVVPPRTAP